MKIFFILFAIIAYFFINFSSSFALTSDESKRLVQTGVRQHIQYQSYVQTHSGPTGVMGYYFDRFITQQVFTSLGIFGAVSGDRGGYGIAALGMGLHFPINHVFGLEIRSMLGSGGGGGVPAGGGFCIQNNVGGSFQLTPEYAVELGFSDLMFPSGSLHTSVWYFGAVVSSYMISVK